jgi:hypothetical protein
VLYVKTFTKGPGASRLLDTTRESVARDCKDAALDLLSGIARGWEKRELAEWLVGPYAHATRHTPRGERIAVFDGGAPIADAAIDELLTRVRVQTLASLERAVLDGGALDFSAEIIHRGIVTRAFDAEGADVWLPRDPVRLRLRDRVRSLFVAHYMNDPAAYDTLFVCPRCEEVSFDALAKETGLCGHRRISGMVPRGGASDASGIRGAVAEDDARGVLQRR